MTSYANPVRIRMGSRTLEGLPEIVGDRSVLLLMSQGGAERLGERLRHLLGPRIAYACSSASSNPTIADCASLQDETADIGTDAILAVGGGSVIDAAKALAAQRAAPSRGWLSRHLRAGEPVPEAFAPPAIIAVPTTAGTGSEVTSWATVWDEAEPRKHSLQDQTLYPEAAILDPELTLTLPEEPTLTAALDAWSHAMEAVWNRNANPVSDALAAAAIRRIPDALRRTLAAPGDLQARADLQNASLLAGLAFSNTQTALAHSISYPLTASFGLPHGLACSFTLAEVLRTNATEDPQRLRIVTNALGVSSVSEASDVIYELFAEVGLSDFLKQNIPAPEALMGLQGRLIDLSRATNNLARVDESRAGNLLRSAYGRVMAGSAVSG